jgi:hypothetical protein
MYKCSIYDTTRFKAVWQWTYQNSAVKRAAVRAISGWVTSWEVWYGEPKADSIVSLGVDKFSSKLVYKNAIYPFAGKNCFFYYYYFNCNGKVGRSNAFLIKFLPILSLQLKKKCDSYIKWTHAIFINWIIFSKCQKETHREYTTKRWGCIGI